MQATVPVSEKFPNLSKLSAGYLHKAKADPQYIRVTFRKMADFIPETVTQIAVNKDVAVTAIVGIVRAKKLQCAVSAMRFPKSQFTMEQAQQWIAENFSINNN